MTRRSESCNEERFQLNIKKLHERVSLLCLPLLTSVIRARSPPPSILAVAVMGCGTSFPDLWDLF
jgi:hypothetical protein